jgi:hypothetical protein
MNKTLSCILQEMGKVWCSVVILDLLLHISCAGKLLCMQQAPDEEWRTFPLEYLG